MSNKSLNFGFLILIIAFSIGCVEVRDPEAKKNKEAVGASQPTIQWEVRPLSGPQKYEVILKGVSEGSQIVRKSLNFIKQSSTDYKIAQSPVFSDIVESGGVFEYLVQLGTQVTKIEVIVPQDLIIEGEVDIKSLPLNLQRDQDEWKTLETEGRIYFRAGALITTQGAQLLIKARSIESEGATIQTFNLSQTAEALHEGRNGGQIKLVADELRGTLHFVMRGEHGGYGQLPFQNRKGVPFDNRGRRGGNSGLLISEIKDLSRGALSVDFDPGKGGKGTELKSFCMDPNCTPVTIIPQGPDGRDGIVEQPVGRLR